MEKGELSNNGEIASVARALILNLPAEELYGAMKEADVDERSRVLMATFLGAVVGGVWGWLYMTEGGRRVRDRIEPKLDDFMNELTRVRGTVEKARTAANEGWRSLSDIAGGAQGRWSA
jgi:hypothetical protein